MKVEIDLEKLKEWERNLNRYPQHPIEDVIEDIQKEIDKYDEEEG